jgi:hypothetical protein
VLEDRDLAEVTVHIQPDEPHPAPFLLARQVRKRANDTYGSVLAAHPGSRRGGQVQHAGAQPIGMDGLPCLRSPKLWHKNP